MVLEMELKMDYHHWANVKMLNHLKALGQEVFVQEVKSIFPSVSSIFSHIYQVDRMWLNRMLGKSDPAFENITFDCADAALSHFEQLYRQFKNLDLHDRKITYQNTRGELFQNDVHEIVQHVMNHGTYHRGNVSAVLHQLGQKNVSTDYIYFLRDMPAKS